MTKMMGYLVTFCMASNLRITGTWSSSGGARVIRLSVVRKVLGFRVAKGLVGSQVRRQWEDARQASTGLPIDDGGGNHDDANVASDRKQCTTSQGISLTIT